MICAIFERRPRTLRSISDSRAAKPIGQIEFDDQLRHHENVKVIKDKLAELGHKLATTPSKSTHPEFGFIVYVEPVTAKSSKEATAALKKNKPVKVGGASGVSRRLPLPSLRKRRK